MKSPETVNVRVDADQKQQLEKLAEKKGFSLSDLIRNFLSSGVKTEYEKSPEIQLEELESEQQRLQTEIAEIQQRQAEEERQEKERQRVQALKKVEAKIRQEFPPLNELTGQKLPAILNEGIEKISEIAKQYDAVIDQIESKQVEILKLKQQYEGLGGGYDSLATELKEDVEVVDLSEEANDLLALIKKNRSYAGWLQRSDSVLRFLDTRYF